MYSLLTSSSVGQPPTRPALGWWWRRRKAIQQKKSSYWRAVDAIKKYAKEDEHFILAPGAFGIHEAASMDLLGSLSNDGYMWNEEAVKRMNGNINMVELKKATLQRRRRQ